MWNEQSCIHVLDFNLKSAWRFLLQMSEYKGSVHDFLQKQQ